MVHSDKSELDLSDVTIIIQNFPFSWMLWRKNGWKLLKLLRCRKTHSFQAIKLIDHTFELHKMKT